MKLFLFLFLSVLSFASAALWSTTTVAKDEVSETLDRIEALVQQGCKAAKSCVPFIKASAATVLLLQGPKLYNTVLLLQALKVAGLPLVQKSIDALGQAYRRSRNKLTSELPAILAAKKEMETFPTKLASLKADAEKWDKLMRSDIENLQASLKSGKIKQDQFDQLQAKATALFDSEKAKVEKQIQEIRETKKKIDAASSALKSILSATEPEQLKEIFFNSYKTALATMTVAKSKTAASVTMGLNFGTQIFESVKYMLGNHLHLLQRDGKSDAPTWLATSLQAASSSLGVLLSFLLKKTAMTYAACTMGSEILVTQLVQAVDPVLKRMKLPPISASPVATQTLQTAITAIAVLHQLKSAVLSAALAKLGGGGKDKGAAAAPGRVSKADMLLAPFMWFEGVLERALSGA